MPFKPGQSGNPAGLAAGQPRGMFLAALARAIKQSDGQKVRDAAEKLLELAAAGEAWAVKELADRLDGKATQAVTLGGDAENPVFLATIRREIVRGSDTPTSDA